MTACRSFFFKKNYFISMFLLLLNLGCFIFSSKNKHNQQPRKKKRNSHKSFSSSTWSFLKRIFSSNNPKVPCSNERSESSTSSSSSCLSTTPSITLSSSEEESLVVSLVPTETVVGSDNLPRKRRSHSFQDFDFSTGRCFSVQTEILPCPTCGEIFHKMVHLENHQYIKHAVSELFDGDSGKNVVKIIFKNGWIINEQAGNQNYNPLILRILKIHNRPKILTRFEEYRESVKSKAARNGAGYGSASERCLADGNELLRFHCTTFLCELGRNGNSSLCNKQHCNLCGIIRSGFSAKMDGISTLSSSSRAHEAIPDEIEQEFAFMNVKRAMLVCRVVAGRVGCDSDEEVAVEKEDGGFDSVVAKGSGGGSGVLSRGDDDDELLVFNPRAVLPCFVIVYKV